MGQSDHTKNTILYVDDGEANLYLFEESFQEDYNVLTALSGAEGLEMVKNENPDVIISDQAMPGMTGVEFFEEVLKINPDPNRILLTAFSDIKALADAVNKAKIYQYLNKPWDYERLKTIIDHAIHEYRLRKQNIELTGKLKKQTIELQELLNSKTELLNQLEKSNKALEKSENRLQRIIDLSPVPIVIEDLSGNIHLLNDRFQQVFGYTLHDIPTNEQWYRLAYPDSETREKHEQLWNHSINSARKENSIMVPIETIVRCKNGEDKVVQIQSAPIDNNIVTMIHDLTKIKNLEKDISYRIQMEEALRKAKDKADAASKSKSEFIASMSHEIRTPMNSILGFANVLEQELENPHMVDYVQSIQTSGKTLLSLINDILDFSKIEAGKTEIKYEPVNIRSLIHDITEIFRFSAKEKKLELHATVDEKVPEVLMLDELRLKQILLNLGSNAVKFTEKGAVEINVCTGSVSDTEVELLIRVKDTGIGIAREQQKNVFKVFEQMQGQDNKKYGGTGLGLAISNKLAALMNGNILLESKQNKGSTFTLKLNRIKVADAPAGNKREKTDVKEIVDFKPAKILIVDDVESNRKVLKLKFRKYHFEVFEATNALEALSLLNKITPDILFVDLYMPGMDGYELYKKIRVKESLKHVPAIAVTAYTLDNDEQNVMDAGFSDYLSKPVDFKKIDKILKRYLPYEIVPADEKEKKQKPDYELSSKALERLPELIDQLEKESAPYLEKMKNIQPKKIVAEFAQRLVELGDKYDNTLVSDYGTEILDASRAFNVEREKLLIRQFGQFMEELKKNIQS
ncbi:MAG: response regulator [Bacteroidales bacterium]|jgi:PAS domain S-box-containing protein|nr:response regulator [Bacteroidales bacterium]